MSELEQYYREFACSGVWAVPAAVECGCQGRGWWLSEVDTWHKCRYHYDEQPDPEAGPEEWEAYHKWVDMGRRPRPQAAKPLTPEEPPPMADGDIPF